MFIVTDGSSTVTVKNPNGIAGCAFFICRAYQSLLMGYSFSQAREELVEYFNTQPNSEDILNFLTSGRFKPTNSVMEMMAIILSTLKAVRGGYWHEIQFIASDSQFLTNMLNKLGDFSSYDKLVSYVTRMEYKNPYWYFIYYHILFTNGVESKLIVHTKAHRTLSALGVSGKKEERFILSNLGSWTYEELGMYVMSKTKWKEGFEVREGVMLYNYLNKEKSNERDFMDRMVGLCNMVVDAAAKEASDGSR